jgi:hypothetical protein
LKGQDRAKDPIDHQHRGEKRRHVLLASTVAQKIQAQRQIN